MLRRPLLRCRPALRAPIHVLLVALLVGCGASSDATAPSGNKPGAPASIVLATDGPSGGPLGATLRSPFRATVTDASGRVVPGVQVTFSVSSGVVLSPSVTTDSLGNAATRVQLPVARGTVTLTATAGKAQTSIPLTVTGITFGHLTLASESTCGISVEGYGYCWGRPYGAINIATDSINVPTPMIGAYVFQSIEAGGNGGCGIATDSTAVCWGDFPASATSPAGYLPPTPVSGGLKFRSISRGDYGACGVSVAGAVYCWGRNYTGQIGSSTVPLGAATATPTPADLPGTFASVHVGQYHVCALSTTGQAYCWGENLTARATAPDGTDVACIGLTLPGCVSAPAPVTTSLRFTSLAIGSNSTCGIATDGSTYCWGRNESGELGTGDSVSSVTPRQVTTTVTFSQISGGDRGFCGLTAAGDVYCWGAFPTGIGIPFGSCPVAGWDCQPTPAPAPAQGLHFSSIAAREGELCGFVSGVAYCWGFNWAGKLGTGTSQNNASDPHPIALQP